MQPTFPIPRLSRAEKIACLKRELVIRQRVYTRDVIEGRMKHQAAQHEIDCISAMIADYCGNKDFDIAEDVDLDETMMFVSRRLQRAADD